jgi:hypothetical protein
MRGKNPAPTSVSDTMAPSDGGTSMTRMIGNLRRWIGAIAVVAISAILLSAAPAFADTTPADGQYSGNLGQEAGGGGSLPFTGLNLLVLVAAGGGLAAAGAGLRAAARR